MSEDIKHVILSDRYRFPDETGAGRLRTQCAFTSRDMAADWPEAFVYAVVYGWGRDETDPTDDTDCYPELAERYGWDETLIAFLRDAHERFKALPDKIEQGENR